MDYNSAIEYIHGTYKFGSKLGLENISLLLDKMGNPQEKLKVIHVAGTNGKGSTAAFISSILMESGFKVGLFTSPYLEEFNERIRINRDNISNDDLGNIVEIVKNKVDEMIEEGFNHPTEFEIVTATAFYYYFIKNVDIVVLEVGLGGRLDSTNVVKKPLVSVITPIALDHVEYLGDTISKIASEKAGIIKANCPVVYSWQEKEAEDVIIEKAYEMNSKTYKADSGKEKIIFSDLFSTKYEIEGIQYEIKIPGLHQISNSLLALKVMEVMKNHYNYDIAIDDIKSGLKKAVWPGRFEVMKKDPLIIIDGAHNIHGISSLAQSIEKYLKNKKLIAVVGILGDKDYKSMIDITGKYFDEIIVTEPNNPRALDGNILLNIIKEKGIKSSFEKNIENAVLKAINIKEKDCILIFGSLYMIGEARTFIKNLNLTDSLEEKGI